MKIFLLLNGVGVVFLVYVLVQFWKEEHRTKCRGRAARCRVPYQNRAKIVVVTRPITLGAQADRSVVPFRAMTGT